MDGKRKCINSFILHIHRRLVFGAERQVAIFCIGTREKKIPAVWRCTKTIWEVTSQSHLSLKIRLFLTSVYFRLSVISLVIDSTCQKSRANFCSDVRNVERNHSLGMAVFFSASLEHLSVQFWARGWQELMVSAPPNYFLNHSVWLPLKFSSPNSLWLAWKTPHQHEEMSFANRGVSKEVLTQERAVLLCAALAPGLQCSLRRADVPGLHAGRYVTHKTRGQDGVNLIAFTEEKYMKYFNGLVQSTCKCINIGMCLFGWL